MNYYGYRYLTTQQFNSYCADLNVEMDSFNRELELYEREEVLFPVARVIKPAEYVIARSKLERQPATYGQSLSGWEDLERLLDVSIRPQHQDDEDLWHPFDVEVEHGNTFLHVPLEEEFKSWDSFKVKVEGPRGLTYSVPTAEHYYHYWQVHQVYQIQRKYPIFAKHNWLLEHLSNEIQVRIKPKKGEPVTTLSGYDRCFDALSFYICLTQSQRQKTFASIPQKYGMKKLNDQQLAAHERELVRHAQFVCRKYEIDGDALYKFLVFLLHLQSNYRDEERTKLANELESDIMFLTQFIRDITGQTSSQIEEYLGTSNTIWTQRQFRHLDRSLLVRDTSHDVFIHFMLEYNKDFPNDALTSSDIERFEQFLSDKGLFLIDYAIFDVQEILNNPRPFEKTSFYIALKNLTTGLECCLREIAMLATITGIKDDTLFTLISTVFTWGSAFQNEHQSKKTIWGQDDVSYINDIYTDPNLNNTLKSFLIAYCGRNLLAHKYSVEDDLHYDVYHRVYLAIIFALFYSWKYTLKNAWV